MYMTTGNTMDASLSDLVGYYHSCHWSSGGWLYASDMLPANWAKTYMWLWNLANRFTDYAWTWSYLK